LTFSGALLAHGYIYRWPSTRLSDARIDAALTRLAGRDIASFKDGAGAMMGPVPSV